MQKSSPRLFRFTSLMMALALCQLGLVNTVSVFATGATEAAPAKAATAAPKKDDTQIVGQLIVSGSVTVNDKRAITGTTVFSNARIAVACNKGSNAIVNLGRLGRVELSPGTKLVLRFGEGIISGDLLEGKAVASTTVGTKLSINTPDGLLATDGKDAAVTPVNTQRGVRCVPAMVASSGSSVSALGPAALAAVLVGIGGGVAAGAVAALVDDGNLQVSPILR